MPRYGDDRYETVYEDNQPGDHPTSRRYKRQYSRYTKREDVPREQAAPMQPREGVWYTRHDGGVQPLVVEPTSEDSLRGDLALDGRKTHPSWGIATIHRVQGTRRLFGSEMEHPIHYQLVIQRAARERTSCADHYSPRETLLELELTAAQFVGLMSNQNVNAGTPVTIHWTEKDKYHPRWEHESVIDKIRHSVSKDIAMLGERADKIEKLLAELLEQKTVRKSDVRSVHGQAVGLVRDIRSNIPFHAQQAAERLEGMVSAAQAEVDSLLGAAVERLGMKALAENQDALRDVLDDLDVTPPPQLPSAPVKFAPEGEGAPLDDEDASVVFEPEIDSDGEVT